MLRELDMNEMNAVSGGNEEGHPNYEVSVTAQVNDDNSSGGGTSYDSWDYGFFDTSMGEQIAGTFGNLNPEALIDVAADVIDYALDWNGDGDSYDEALVVGAIALTAATGGGSVGWYVAGVAVAGLAYIESNS